MKQKTMKNKNGFSLFELLVSISIIGILVALASVSYSNAQRKARDSKMVQDLNMIQKAAEQYYSGNNYNYPTTYNSTAVWTGYLERFPLDPKGNEYIVGSGSATGYCLCANLDSDTGNSNVTNCSAFVASGGNYYCVKNQQ